MAVKKILALSSGGGHWVEMMRILPALDGHDIVFASPFDEYRKDVPGHRFHTFLDVNRFTKRRLFAAARSIWAILAAERPDVVLTTGAAPGFLALALAKIFFRSRTIWIDSIANCERLSTSGSFARPVADLWLTQWADVAGPKGPHYWGAVL